MRGLGDGWVAFQRWILGTAAAMLALGLWEWLVLLWLDGPSLQGARSWLLLLALEIGNLAPYVALASLGLVAVEAGGGWLVRRFGARRGLALSFGATCVLAAPYAVSMGVFTFSGPAARTLRFHGVLVGLAAAAIIFAFAGLAVLLGADLHRRFRRSALASAAVTLAVLVWTSRTTQPNEYEKLHAFLSLWAILLSSLLGRALLPPHWRPRPSLVLAGAAFVVSMTAIALFVAGRVPQVAWVIWSKSGVSRYATTRVSWLEPEVAPDGSNAEITVKPRLDTPETLAARRARAESVAPHIVIFSVDGLRPDHVGAYGYRERPTTPNIDRFAARGVRFQNAFSSFPATARFNTGLLTGRYMAVLPWQHRVPDSFREASITRLLHRRGYHVLVKAWFEHSSQNTFDPAAYQIDTHVAKSKRVTRLEAPLEERLPVMEQHVREARAQGKPSLLWMHLLGTHPVKRKFLPDPAFDFGDSRAARYDSAIAGSDRWLAAVERLMLETADPARPTIWIICSDHGIRVDEDGRSLYSSIIRVPLIVVAPGVSPAVRSEPIDTSLDLAATVLDFAGVAPPEEYDGVSLLPLLEGGGPTNRMPHRLIPLMRRGIYGAVYGPFKLLDVRGTQSLVNMEEDPAEEHNIIDRYRGLARLMQERAQVELQLRTEAIQRGLGASEGADEEDE
ncbi:MAG: hypothetical protein EOO73_18325 [Myxococcales bacterium]|nr:MAG: hypothetical protein EOO73_18325 [Myxococcales bacterium]